ncbi:MAG: DUF1552 domain-containing protein [Planctomycetaceae bacterium]|jgi:hypothetical protein|nr:DUF1552 domain-containing protein [Planctomycetaceae bacterium]
MTNIKRRTMLRGFGLCMGLPLLDVMHSTALANNGISENPTRMAFVFFANGAIMDSWKPTTQGSQYELPRTLEVLKEHKSDFNVVTGLAQNWGRAHGDGPGDHARCASTYLTGAHPYKTSGADIKVGVSVDQAAANRVGDRTRIPSLELGLRQGRNAGNCDSGYSCAYSNNISWKTDRTPMAKEINPRLAFERLFGDGQKSSESQKKRDFYKASILDLVKQDALQLKKQLGVTDQRKMDEYFQSVRELEIRVLRAQNSADVTRPDLKLPTSVPSDFQEHMHLMYDIMALAFQTDVTRISTLMLGNAGSNRSYNMVGVNEGHHQLSHHRNDDGLMEKIRKIDGYLAKGFSYFLKKLKSVPEGDGNLLDRSMIVYGSGISDANRHSHHDLPIVVAGKANGTIDTGRHINLGKEVPLNNLFLSMLDRMDAGVTSIGDSSGRLKELRV